MRILIADDESMSRRLLQSDLEKWGYDVVITRDGTQAWEALEAVDSPRLVILDWMMPGFTGGEICQRVRASVNSASTYIILLTAKDDKGDVAAGLAAGANDYVTKPFDPDELRARVEVGVRMIELQQNLECKVKELENALAQVKKLQGILPICSYCKNVRDDQNYWQEVESYVTEHSEAQFSHSVCPDCYARELEPQMELMRSRLKATPPPLD